MITIYLDVSKDEAFALADFLKRSGYSDYRNKAVSENEASQMIIAGKKLMDGLEEAGIWVR